MTFPSKRLKQKLQNPASFVASILTFLGITASRFEFAVSRSVSECKERIESQQKKPGYWGWLVGGEVTVEIWSDVSNTYGFRLLKNQPKHPDIYIQGTVHEISANKSLVSGQINTLHGFIYILVVFVMLLVLAVLSASIEGIAILLFLALCFGGVWFISAWFYNHDKNRLLEQFKKILSE